jgi:hypothetical protein
MRQTAKSQRAVEHEPRPWFEVRKKVKRVQSRTSRSPVRMYAADFGFPTLIQLLHGPDL